MRIGGFKGSMGLEPGDEGMLGFGVVLSPSSAEIAANNRSIP